MDVTLRIPLRIESFTLNLSHYVYIYHDNSVSLGHLMGISTVMILTCHIIFMALCDLLYSLNDLIYKRKIS